MKPAKFAYERATSIDDAIRLLSAPGADARIIAGGQSLIPALNFRLSAPALLVDIAGIEQLREIRIEAGVLRIGAGTRHADILRSELIAHHAPLMTTAAPFIAHPAIRNRGTLGGSLALADPAAEWPACMVALDARIVIAGPAGRREAAAVDFFQGVYSVDMAADEMIVEIRVPVANADECFAFDEIARRHGDFAIAGLALRWRGGASGTVRLVLFGVGDRPEPVDLPAADVLAALRGGDSAGIVARAVEKLDPSADPYVSTEYRLHVARVLCERLLRRVMGDAS
ncbi:MAG: FAD binding domain-containing protein [Beijerinckiaceae bacterium]